MFHFKDFAPQMTKKSVFKVEYQTFEEALASANTWITENQIDVVNLETVVIPEMRREEGTTDGAFLTSSDMMNTWYQFIRVWYKK